MNARPRIAYLTPNALLHPNRGGRIRAYHLWRAMSAYADVFPIIVGDTEGAQMRGLMRMTGARFFPRRRYRDAAQGAAAPGLFELLNETTLPMERLEELSAPDSLVRHCLNSGRVERMLQTLSRLRPQLVVVCDTSLGILAPQIRALGVMTVVGPHNFDSALYEGMAHQAATPSRKLWNHLAAQAFRAVEEMFAPYVDQLWVCSAADAQRFGGKLVEPAKIRVLPNVFDVEAPSPMNAESRDLVFVGQAIYYPNEDAIRNLFEISRTLDARGVAHRLRIVGRVSERVKADARAHPSVDMVGYVPSVAPYVEGAAVAPIALTMGGGTRIKILEALSLARPVLSTPIGIEGIECENGVSAVVEPDLAAFPDRIEELLSDRARAERIALAGWELAKQRYSHEALVGYVGAALRDLGLSEGKPSGASLGRNLGACVESESASFNAVTRLLVWRAIVRVVAPAEALSAGLACEFAPDLPNAFVQVRPAGAGKVWLNGSAILPADVAPSALEMRLRAWGATVLTWTPPAEIAPQTAGMLTLEPSGSEEMELVAWGLSGAVSFSPDLPAPAPQNPGPVADVAFAAGRFARGVARLDVATADGQGQSFDKIKSWLECDPSSRRLSDLKDKHAGEAAWIVGNGPSVSVADLDRLSGRLVICFNRFHLAHESTKLRASYTFSGDAQMIEDFGQRIVDESGGIVFIAHHAAPDLVGDYIWLRQAQVFPPLFSKRPDRVVSPGGSTPYVAMQVAYYMGIRKFYFYGADFMFRFAGVKTGAPTFRSATGEGNHFISNYRAGRPWCPPSLPDIGAAFFNARLIMEAEGGFIRNVTRGGALEIFPREDFESALASA
jgi:glycosyltransferase involved in cell wall biosynthesis